jgi:hypothetical protein
VSRSSNSAADAQPSRRPTRDGDIVEVSEFVVEYGRVVEDGEMWVLLPRSGTRVRRRALGPVSVLERFDAILGYDSEDCAHLWDRTNGKVSVRYHGVENRQFDVADDRATLAAYLQWLEREHEREWWRETMPEWALEALRGGDRR